eukprot:TRINITY_DN23359_c0_g1_i1.p2 TRINITY_DN23359_c0_g1~~TRINITY_DN23359_c0_g1_i1.p2  ORF type:complete len:187 (-),score=45.00 TRINITY_DN23359_c0_g1_i1:790-1350(-)
MLTKHPLVRQLCFYVACAMAAGGENAVASSEADRQERVLWYHVVRAVSLAASPSQRISCVRHLAESALRVLAREHSMHRRVPLLLHALQSHFPSHNTTYLPLRDVTVLFAGRDLVLSLRPTPDNADSGAGERAVHSLADEGAPSHRLDAVRVRAQEYNLECVPVEASKYAAGAPSPSSFAGRHVIW